MLARPLHAQLFPPASTTAFPPPDPASINIARGHLRAHGLDPAQGSVLPDTAFALPALQGHTLDEHFHRIGAAAAEPYLGLAQQFAHAELPPRPLEEEWALQSGWTKYTYVAGGGSFHEHVESLDGVGAVCFDVETMPNEGHMYPVLATAATQDAWYAWISPWLLSESDDPAHLIPIGGEGMEAGNARLIIGHNISYDRARILDEYTRCLPLPSSTQNSNLNPNRFLDTMSLHIAVKGISSGQRPAWMKHRRGKDVARRRWEEAVGAVVSAIAQLKDAEARLTGTARQGEAAELLRMRCEMEDSLPQLLAQAPIDAPIGEGSSAGDGEEAQRWEDLTSLNSLAEVARLHCGLTMDKTVRDDFMTCTPHQIRADARAYLAYCAADVHTTHAVFAKVLPRFLERCPSPVSFAGVLSMGSAFLPVDEGWEGYLEEAEGRFRELEGGVKGKLLELAEAARAGVEAEAWKGDPWLGQLDWTMKEVRKRKVLKEVGSAFLHKQDCMLRLYAILGTLPLRRRPHRGRGDRPSMVCGPLPCPPRQILARAPAPPAPHRLRTPPRVRHYARVAHRHARRAAGAPDREEGEQGARGAEQIARAKAAGARGAGELR